jgi:UDP-2,4-diacetamido-2,4,6-trideoxy-beta-L-altropyranose hydrolase
MKVVVRADASILIGTGHVARCRTLGDELRRRGVDVTFVCRPHEGNLIESLEAGGYQVVTLKAVPLATPAATADGYAAWLGTAEGDDAAETLAAIGEPAIDWFIVDHYALSAVWHRMVRRRTRRIMVIDDLADRQLDCDLFLDQNQTEVESATRYRGLVPAGCEGLFGPRFALLSSAYRERRRTVGPRDGRVRRMLVTMGGSDAADATGFVVGVMSAPELRHVMLDVVVGAKYPHIDRLRRQLTRRGNGEVRRNLPSLVDAIAGADIAIGAGGSTTWERLCLGLPTIVMSIADNQIAGCRALDKAGAGIYAGHFGDVTADRLSAIVRAMIANPTRLRDLSTRGLDMVDGRGTERVVERLMALT